MKLFNKFQSRAFQFSLDLLVQLNCTGRLSERDLNQLVTRYGLSYADQILHPLMSAGLIERTGKDYTLSSSLRMPSLPISNVEQEYLQYILQLPEAALFLNDATIDKLSAMHTHNILSDIQQYRSDGSHLPRNADVFRTFLRAIRERRLISNRYTDRASGETLESTVLPWRMEYDAKDYRWWVILYNPNEKRMIKARLDSFREIALLDGTTIPEEDINLAMDELLDPEPVIIRVKNERGALERCFLLFESHLFEDTRQLSKDFFELRFRFYRFDRTEILKKLLYMGPQVTLCAPSSLQGELLDFVHTALTLNSNANTFR